MLQVGQRLRDDFVLGELVDGDVHFGLRILRGLLARYSPACVARSTGVLFHSSVPSKSIDRSITSGGGGGGWIRRRRQRIVDLDRMRLLGIVMMKMMRSTSMTSISGVMLISE